MGNITEIIRVLKKLAEYGVKERTYKVIILTLSQLVLF